MIRVNYIGGTFQDTDKIWGGTAATNYALVKSLGARPDIELNAKFRDDFASVDEIRDFLNSPGVSHVDDTGVITLIHQAGLPAPDVIGPITRSPIKNYQGWRASYPAEWFYKAQIIRLNYAEERKNPDLVTLIRHGVDTELLRRKNNDILRKYVLWAGNIHRWAKNYHLMEEIEANVKLPAGYEFKTLANYRAEDYWDLLEETAILINTSRYESFCCAAFEAMAKEVPVIWRRWLQGGVHEMAGIRVGYDFLPYRRTIMNLLEDRNYLSEGKRAREYCENNASLEIMGQDLVEIYEKAQLR